MTWKAALLVLGQNLAKQTFNLDGVWIQFGSLRPEMNKSFKISVSSNRRHVFPKGVHQTAVSFRSQDNKPIYSATLQQRILSVRIRSRKGFGNRTGSRLQLGTAWYSFFLDISNIKYYEAHRCSQTLRLRLAGFLEVKAERSMKPKRCDDRIDTVWVEDEYSMVKISPSMASGIFFHLRNLYPPSQEIWAFKLRLYLNKALVRDHVSLRDRHWEVRPWHHFLSHDVVIGLFWKSDRNTKTIKLHLVNASMISIDFCWIPHVSKWLANPKAV